MNSITKQSVEQTLAMNPSWVLMPPRDESVEFADASKAWKQIRAVTVNVIVKNLEKCLEDNGHDYMVAVWAICQRQMAVRSSTNWHRPCGPMAIWRAMYKKASLRVQQQHPKRVGEEAVSAVEDIMARSQQIAAEMAK